MRFRDAAAAERQRTSAAVKRFTDVLYPDTVDGVQFTDHQPVGPARWRNKED